MGDDAALLKVVSSANLACGGHAGDPSTMVRVAEMARANGVVIGAHPGFADRQGFGRRVIPLTMDEVAELVATQVGAMIGAAALSGARVAYVKPHGALANWAAAKVEVAEAIARAVRALPGDLAVLAISGTALETVCLDQGVEVYSEVFADRGYQPNGQLVPRSQPGALIENPSEAVERLVGFLRSGQMPCVGGGSVTLRAHSICVHGDTRGALAMAQAVRTGIESAGFAIAPFVKLSDG